MFFSYDLCIVVVLVLAVVVVLLSCLVELCFLSIFTFIWNELLIHRGKKCSSIQSYNWLIGFRFFLKIVLIFGSKLIIQCNKGSHNLLYIYIYILNTNLSYHKTIQVELTTLIIFSTKIYIHTYTHVYMHTHLKH